MNRLRWLFRRRRTDHDLSREMQAHIAERIDELVEEGLEPAAARAQALREFGNATFRHEQSGEVWMPRWLTQTSQDVRYAVRSLVRYPGFSVTAVLILAVGMGLVTTLATVLNGQFLKPWPVPDPSAIVIVKPLPPPDRPWGALSNLEYRYLREHSRSFLQLATWMGGGGLVGFGPTTKDVQTNFVSANYFDMLKIGMLKGRGFAPEEEDYVTPRAVAVISERLWRQDFGAPESIIGETIHYRGAAFTVVGVAEIGFADVNYIRGDVWMPLPSAAVIFPGDNYLQRLADPKGSSHFVGGRLRDGISRATAQAELDVLGRQFSATVPMDSFGFNLTGTRPIDMNAENVMRQLPGVAAAFGALFLVMLVACGNVGNLILVRSLSRQRETAIRLAIGGSRSRVARQMLAESLVLCAVAAALALMMASRLPRLVESMAGDTLRNTHQLAPDYRVFALTFGLSLLACLATGLAPALRTTRVALSRTGHKQADPRRTARLTTALLASQIAMSTVLLVCAGLLGRAIPHALSLDPGFAVAPIELVSMDVSGVVPEAGRPAAFRAMRDAAKAAGLSVAFADFPPVTSSYMNGSFREPHEGRERSRMLLVRPVSTAYFDVMRIGIVRGRAAIDSDEPREIVVNESAARVFWRDENPIGKILVSGNDDTTRRSQEVVGVVKDVPVVSLSRTEPTIYSTSRFNGPTIVARHDTPASSERLRQIMATIAPGARTTSRPLTDDLKESLRDLAFASRFVWAIGALALTLATVGAFGVFAYLVEERRREIGVRMALGARAPQVFRLVLGGLRWPLTLGLGSGFALAVAAASLLRRSLYGLSPIDPIAYLQVAVILAIAAFIATWIPARRATRVDPAIALRAD